MYYNSLSRLHDLGHTHASLLLEQGVSIDTISRRLGHENSVITRKIYLHVTKNLKRKIMIRFLQSKLYKSPLFVPFSIFLKQKNNWSPLF